ncbi:MAG: alpha/beta hydrolase [Cyanobacteria bacterium P01_C01_bin.89]
MAWIEIRTVPHFYDLSAPRHGRCALIFLHGWLLSRRYWQPIIQQVAGDYQCLTYDLRGFGESQSAAMLTGDTAIAQKSSSSQVAAQRKRFDAHSPLAYAEDLKELMNGLGIDRAWLVGHSLGGTVALWGAHHIGDRIAGVICLNSGGGIYLEEEFRTFRTIGQRLVNWRPRWLRDFPLLHWMFRFDSVPKPLPMEWGRQRAIDFMTADGESALGSLLSSTTRTEVHRLPQLVSQLKQPAYFIAGERDTVMEPRYVRHLASYHPLFGVEGSNLIELPGCGHMGMIERPQEVSGHILRILDRHPSAQLSELVGQAS